jgi:hypothetical protein
MTSTETDPNVNPGAETTTETATKPTEAKSVEYPFTVDRLGRKKLTDARGRYVNRLDGTVAAVRRARAKRARRRAALERKRAERLEGKRLLPGVDTRSLPFLRYVQIVHQIASDQGGGEGLSAARQQLIRRFAATSVLAEQLEIRIAKGELVDIQELATLSSTLVRLASRIGIDRIAKPVTDLDSFLSARAKAKRQDAIEARVIEPDEVLDK